MLTVQELCAHLGRAFKLEEVSFRVAPGERVAVLGPSGAGKSTLLELIAGLRAPRSGSISWAETVLSQGRRICVPPERRGVGLLLQEGALFPHLSVPANVALGLPRRTARPQQRELVDRALESVQAAHLRDRRVPSLSGGEQQRVALARALVQLPRLMLLDEPFHSLDSPLKRAILGELRALVGAHRIAAVLVTHDTLEAAAFADRVVLLQGGRIVQQGSLDELYHSPVDGWVARFLGDVRSIDVAPAGAAGIALPDGPHDGQHDERVRFRPEDVVLTRAEQGLAVGEVRRQGATQEVTLILPDGSSLLARVPAHCEIAVGDRVQARIVRALPPSVREVVQP